MIGRLTTADFLLAITLTIGLIPFDLSAQRGEGSTPVTRLEVWEAVLGELGERGVSGEQLPRAQDLDLPATPPARAGRKLQVASACWDDARERVQFRLQCAGGGDCLPFLAYLSGVDLRNGDLRSVISGAREDAACRVIAGPRAAAPSSSKLAEKSTSQPVPQPTLRPGDPATAVFTGDGMRMTASVTCLDRGHEGETVRVRGPDGNIFRARISGPARLEVSLR